MASDPARDRLFTESVVVTGTHYSMTTLVGRILGASPDFHLLHEPTNARPTLSYDSIMPERWYRFYFGAEYPELRAFLQQAMSGTAFPKDLAERLARVRTPRDLLQLSRYAQRKLPMRLSLRRAVFKDPFLAFSARSLQGKDGLRVVLTVRHPAAFAESFVRAGNGFDFSDLLQPSLLQSLPELADELQAFTVDQRPLAEQAGLLWRAVYGFANHYYRRDPRTLVLTQDEFVAETASSVDRLFAFAEARRGRGVDRLLQSAFSGSRSDFGGTGSYIARDPSRVLGKWRKRLPAEDIEMLRKTTGPLGETYGYVADSWVH